jgi:hypothetical protein
MSGVGGVSIVKAIVITIYSPVSKTQRLAVAFPYAVQVNTYPDTILQWLAEAFPYTAHTFDTTIALNTSEQLQFPSEYDQAFSSQ